MVFILCAGIVRSGLAQRFYIHEDKNHFNHFFHRNIQTKLGNGIPGHQISFRVKQYFTSTGI
jgi:hypothetical protein